MDQARWRATVYYRTDSGTVDVEHSLSELYDLHDFVEAGPHWDTINASRWCVNHCEDASLTVEEAARR